jgi:hypothetical protein
MLGQRDTPSFPLCQHEAATIEHILLHYTDPSPTRLRTSLDETLTDMITNNLNVYRQEHPESTHATDRTNL